MGRARPLVGEQLLAVLALLVLVGVLAGCGFQPRPVDRVYDEISAELAAAYDELGEPEASFATMSKVQQLAMDRLSERWREWPAPTSYSLSAMPDHVVVYVVSDGVERRGEWRP